MNISAAVFHQIPAVRLHSTLSLVTTLTLQIDAAAMALHIVVESDAKWDSHVSVRCSSPF
jgi:hypothetical protein